MSKWKSKPSRMKTTLYFYDSTFLLIALNVWTQIVVLINHWFKAFSHIVVYIDLALILCTCLFWIELRCDLGLWRGGGRDHSSSPLEPSWESAKDPNTSSSKPPCKSEVSQLKYVWPQLNVCLKTQSFLFVFNQP